MKRPLLELRSVSKSFDGLRVLERCALTLQEGEIVGLAAANGAGKTVLCDIVCGFTRADDTTPPAEILFRGTPIGALPPEIIARRGIGRAFQNTPVFERLTLLESLLVAAVAKRLARPAGAHFSVKRAAQKLALLLSPARVWLPHAGASHPHESLRRFTEWLGFSGIRDEIQHALDFVRLQGHGRAAGSLSAGERQRLAIATMLVLDRDLMILDEVLAHVEESFVPQFKSLLHRLAADGKGVLLIEHRREVLEGVCDRVVELVALPGQGCTTVERAPVNGDAISRI